MDFVLDLLKGDNGIIGQVIAGGVVAGVGGAALPLVGTIVLSILRLPGFRQSFLATAKIGGWVSGKISGVFGSVGESIEDGAQILLLDWIIAVYKHADADDTKGRIKISYTVSD